MPNIKVITKCVEKLRSIKQWFGTKRCFGLTNYRTKNVNLQCYITVEQLEFEEKSSL